jgi:uncharacterized Zn finger protein (UPF0148 family)
MHSVTCPRCGTPIEVDFQPVGGVVWCPTCQKFFSAITLLPKTPKREQTESTHNGNSGNCDPVANSGQGN